MNNKESKVIMPVKSIDSKSIDIKPINKPITKSNATNMMTFSELKVKLSDLNSPLHDHPAKLATTVLSTKSKVESGKGKSSILFSLNNSATLPVALPTSNQLAVTALPTVTISPSSPPAAPGQPSDAVTQQRNGSPSDLDDSRNALKEMWLPVMLSGFGNMGAGMILERIQHWEVFVKLPQLIQLIPPLLGLKGNVEMTLASRLSTHAALGHLEDRATRRRIIVGNISLCQFMATGVGFIAPLIALLFSQFQGTFSDSSSSSSISSLDVSSSSTALLNQFEHHDLNPAKAFLVLSIFVATSGLADVILSSTIASVVIISTLWLKVNADNVATPIAASVGDMLTMCFLVFVSKVLFNVSHSYPWLPLVPLSLWIVIVISTGLIARRNPFTRSQVFQGLSPLMVSIFLQNISGVLMGSSFRRFPKMAVYQPIINGFGGNLVAVQSSRVTSYLHRHAPKKELVNETDVCCNSPWLFFFGEGHHGKLALLMVLLAGPMQLPLALIAGFLSPASQITVELLLTYYVCATFQVIVILYVGYCFINLLWLYGCNPDDSAIPILTALADLLGIIFLSGGYMFLESIGDVNTVADQNNFGWSDGLNKFLSNATHINATSTLATTIATTATTAITSAVSSLASVSTIAEG